MVRKQPFGVSGQGGAVGARCMQPTSKVVFPSIAPGKLLHALRIQVLYRIRSEHPLMEQTPYRLLFCWFGGLTMVVARYAESCPATD